MTEDEGVVTPVDPEATSPAEVLSYVLPIVESKQGLVSAIANWGEDSDASWYLNRRRAALTSAIAVTKWNPLLHPRGHDGQFIEKGGLVRWLIGLHWHQGKVTNIDPKTGVIQVEEGPTAYEFKDGKKLYAIPKVKARLDLPDVSKSNDKGFVKTGGQAGSNPAAKYKYEGGAANDFGAEWRDALTPGNIYYSDVETPHLQEPPHTYGLVMPVPGNEKLWMAKFYATGTGHSTDSQTFDTHTMAKLWVEDRVNKALAAQHGTPEDLQGKSFYVKQSKSPLHASNEKLANDLYEMAGVPVPNVYLSKDGKSIASEMLPDGKPLSEATPEELELIRENFAVDAWLANWDVIGLANDNIVIVDGVPTRIDAGGSLLFRAQGSPKGDYFADHVTEIDTLRDSHVNPEAAAIFGPTTDEQIKRAVARIAAIPDETIQNLVEKNDMPDTVAATLIMRKHWLIDNYPPIVGNEHYPSAGAHGDLPWPPPPLHPHAGEVSWGIDYGPSGEAEGYSAIYANTKMTITPSHLITQPQAWFWQVNPLDGKGNGVAGEAKTLDEAKAAAEETAKAVEEKYGPQGANHPSWVDSEVNPNLAYTTFHGLELLVDEQSDSVVYPWHWTALNAETKKFVDEGYASTRNDAKLAAEDLANNQVATPPSMFEADWDNPAIEENASIAYLYGYELSAMYAPTTLPGDIGKPWHWSVYTADNAIKMAEGQSESKVNAKLAAEESANYLHKNVDNAYEWKPAPKIGADAMRIDVGDFGGATVFQMSPGVWHYMLWDPYTGENITPEVVGNFDDIGAAMKAAEEKMAEALGGGEVPKPEPSPAVSPQANWQPPLPGSKDSYAHMILQNGKNYYMEVAYVPDPTEGDHFNWKVIDDATGDVLQTGQAYYSDLAQIEAEEAAFEIDADLNATSETPSDSWYVTAGYLKLESNGYIAKVHPVNSGWDWHVYDNNLAVLKAGFAPSTTGLEAQHTAQLEAEKYIAGLPKLTGDTPADNIWMSDQEGGVFTNIGKYDVEVKPSLKPEYGAWDATVSFNGMSIYAHTVDDPEQAKQDAVAYAKDLVEQNKKATTVVPLPKGDWKPTGEIINNNTVQELVGNATTGRVWYNGEGWTWALIDKDHQTLIDTGTADQRVAAKNAVEAAMAAPIGKPIGHQPGNWQTTDWTPTQAAQGDEPIWVHSNETGTVTAKVWHSKDGSWKWSVRDWSTDTILDTGSVASNPEIPGNDPKGLAQALAEAVISNHVYPMPKDTGTLSAEEFQNIVAEQESAIPNVDKTSPAKTTEKVLTEPVKQLGASLSDGSQAHTSQLVKHISQGTEGKITGWPDQEKYPGIVYVQPSDGGKKKKTFSVKKLVAVKPSYQGFLTKDNKEPKIGMKVQGGKAKYVGSIVAINQEKHAITIQLDDGSKKKVSLFTTTVLDESTPSMEESLAKIAKAITVEPEPEYPKPPAASVEKWLGHGRKLTKDGYIPYVGMYVKDKKGESFQVVNLPDEWTAHPENVRLQREDGSRVSRSAANVSIDQEKMTQIPHLKKAIVTATYVPYETGKYVGGTWQPGGYYGDPKTETQEYDLQPGDLLFRHLKRTPLYDKGLDTHHSVTEVSFKVIHNDPDKTPVIKTLSPTDTYAYKYGWTLTGNESTQFFGTGWQGNWELIGAGADGSDNVFYAETVSASQNEKVGHGPSWSIAKEGDITAAGSLEAALAKLSPKPASAVIPYTVEPPNGTQPEKILFGTKDPPKLWAVKLSDGYALLAGKGAANVPISIKQGLTKQEAIDLATNIAPDYDIGWSPAATPSFPYKTSPIGNLMFGTPLGDGTYPYVAAINDVGKTYQIMYSKDGGMHKLTDQGLTKQEAIDYVAKNWSVYTDQPYPATATTPTPTPVTLEWSESTSGGKYLGDLTIGFDTWYAYISPDTNEDGDYSYFVEKNGHEVISGYSPTQGAAEISANAYIMAHTQGVSMPAPKPAETYHKVEEVSTPKPKPTPPPEPATPPVVPEPSDVVPHTLDPAEGMALGNLAPPPKPPEPAPEVGPTVDIPVPTGIGELDAKPIVSAPTLPESMMDVLAQQDSPAVSSGTRWAMLDSDKVADETIRFQVVKDTEGKTYVEARLKLTKEAADDVGDKLMGTSGTKKKMGGWVIEHNKAGSALTDGDQFSVRVGHAGGNGPPVFKPNESGTPNARVLGEPIPAGKNDKNIDTYKVQFITADGQIGNMIVEERPGGSINTYFFDWTIPAPTSEKATLRFEAEQAGWTDTGPGGLLAMEANANGVKVYKQSFTSSPQYPQVENNGGHTLVRTLDDGTNIQFTYTHPSAGPLQYSHARGSTINNEVFIRVPATGSQEEMTKSLSDALQVVGLPESELHPPTDADIKRMAIAKLFAVSDPKHWSPEKIVDATGLPDDAQTDQILAYATQLLEFHRPITMDDLHVFREKDGRVWVGLSNELADAVTKSNGNKYYVHYIQKGSTYGNAPPDPVSGKQRLIDILSNPNPGLLATEERWSRGVNTSGMSSGTDMHQGSGSHMYAHASTSNNIGVGPSSYGAIVISPRIYNRSLEVYANDHDGFGSWQKGISFWKTGGWSEYMLKREISRDSFAYVVVDAGWRPGILQQLHDKGVDEIGGRPIEEVIVTSVPENASTEEFKQLGTASETVLAPVGAVA